MKMPTNSPSLPDFPEIKPLAGPIAPERLHPVKIDLRKTPWKLTQRKTRVTEDIDDLWNFQLQECPASNPEQLLFPLEVITANSEVPMALRGTRPHRKSDLAEGRSSSRGTRHPNRGIMVYFDIRQRKWAERALWKVIDTSEREQNKMGHNLHEGLGQELAGIALLCKVLASKLTKENHAEKDAATDVATLIAETLRSTKDLAKGFYPIELEGGGLLIALQDLADQTSQRFCMHCELRHNGPAPHFGPAADLHLYRIVEESIANSIQHGHAQHILIESRTVNGSPMLSVTDDGIGFGETESENSGVGLHLIGYRARIIGAQIDVEKPDRTGCKITFKLPRNTEPTAQES